MADISLDFQFENPINKVWNALIDSDTLSKWIMANDFQPVVGHKSQFQNPEWNLTVDCEVLVVDEPYKLSYTWVGGPINTIVTWTLKEKDGRTYVHLEQTGFAQEDQAFNGAKYGWASKVEDLKKLLGEI